MKVLLVNKFLYEKGGTETYMLSLGRILAEHGHNVQYYGTADERNTVGNIYNIYAPKREFGESAKVKPSEVLSIIMSRKNKEQMLTLLKEYEPDVVHLNNIQYHLTPSIILAVGAYRRKYKKKVRLIYTTHDYQLICPSHGLFDGKYRICEKCLGGNYLHCIGNKCVKASYAKSILGAMDGFFWRISRAYSEIDAIICPSRFLKSKLDINNVFRDKTIVLHNPVVLESGQIREKKEYVLDFGKFCKDKGTYTLLKACKELPDIKFVFAGYGPAEEDIKNTSNAEYVGFKTGEELTDLISEALFSIYPSEWHENCPYSVLESQILCTPVIASKMGGIPELIRENETGLLFEAGNHADLIDKISILWNDRDRLKEMTNSCRQIEYETPETYYAKLEMIYKG
ncbi:Glycosyltransferase involved in cell wall bisynthesis [Lachnospiraceae bacterium G11]|nr:Glycosyltransferase involved in cell wall bisynthesis [Lachnospiraceae bacterium G11]